MMKEIADAAGDTPYNRSCAFREPRNQMLLSAARTTCQQRTGARRAGRCARRDAGALVRPSMNPTRPNSLAAAEPMFDTAAAANPTPILAAPATAPAGFPIPHTGLLTLRLAITFPLARGDRTAGATARTARGALHGSVRAKHHLHDHMFRRRMHISAYLRGGTAARRPASRWRPARSCCVEPGPRGPRTCRG